MLPFLLSQAWTWFASTGINLALIIVVALFVPRIGRFAERLVDREVTARQADQDSKASLAFAGVGIYIAQAIAYFLLIVLFLQQIGFSLAGAAIPATVVSAAIGFGAQSIIADFMAGFFLLSEKQYGVGDWVRFSGNGVEVEGSVISITMRATTIRTLNQETVTIPNATARVSINTSNYWSRAVVVIPVPLRGSEGAVDVVKRAETATKKALSQEEVAAELIGELDVHPATGVTPPTTEGMPWTMDVRFMIQVEAGSQWLVERAIRMEILQEFWSEYSFAPPSSGQALGEVTEVLSTTLDAATRNLAAQSDAPTEVMKATHPGTTTTPAEGDDHPAGVDSDAQPGGERSGEGHNPVPAALANPDGSDPAAPSEEDKAKSKAAGKEKVADESDAETTVMSAAETDADAGTVADAGEDDPDEIAPWWRTIWFEFRNMRRSTSWLLGILVVLLIAKPLFFSTETEAGDRIAGIFAPPPASAPAEPGEEDADTDPDTADVTGEPTSPVGTPGTPAPTETPTTAPTQPETPVPNNDGATQNPGGENNQQQSTPFNNEPDAPANPQATTPASPTGQADTTAESAPNTVSPNAGTAQGGAEAGAGQSASDATPDSGVNP